MLPNIRRSQDIYIDKRNRKNEKSRNTGKNIYKSYGALAT